MRFNRIMGWAAALCCLAPGLGLAQDAPAAGRGPGAVVWAPKPDVSPYVAPNRPVWHLADLLKAHAGEKSWSQLLVRDADGLSGRYIQMAPGEKTKAMFYVDTSMFWFVQAGQMRVTIEGQQPFVASKGFVIQVPAHLTFQMETLGDAPSLRFEVTHTHSTPFYPLSETPTPIKGYTYQKVTSGPSGSYGNAKPYVDFQKEVVEGGGRPPQAFVRDGLTAASINRVPGAPRPPDTMRGHFHDGTSEFFFIQEGRVGFLIEGEPYLEADQGDIVYAPAGRFHRSGHVGTGMDTRVSIHGVGVFGSNMEPGSGQ